MVASEKLKGALSKLHAEEGRMNFGRKQDQDFYDYMDELVRIAAAQFRDLQKMRNLWGGVIRTAKGLEETCVPRKHQKMR